MQVEGGEPSAWRRGPRPVVLTIGSFDGVHTGHQALIASVIDRADSSQSDAAVLTFDPHPRCVVDPENCPPSVTTIEEQTSLFAEQGVERTFIFPFNEATRQWSAETFCDAIANAVELRAIIIGEDFHFGRGREGNVDFLTRWGAARGVDVTVIKPVLENGEPVSSTRVRQTVLDGDVATAHRLLGRPFFIDAKVVGGEKVGAELGFPTANLAIPAGKLIPQDGVYGGWLKVAGDWHQAAISVGTRPTFSGHSIVVEAFALDFEGNIYGQTVRCAFGSRLRGQERYWTTDDLIAQMKRDVEQVRSTVARTP